MGPWMYLSSQKIFVTLVTGIVIVCGCYFVMYSNDLTLLWKDEQVVLKQKLQFNRNHKTILLWNSFFSEKHFGLGVGHNPFVKANCPISNCTIVDRTDGYLPIPVEEYDVIVFHMGDSSTMDFPSQRKVNQRYIYFNLESPVNTKIRYRTAPHNFHYFNWTMTYRISSDIHFPYGWVAPISEARRVLVMPNKNTPKWIAPNYSLSSADRSLDALLEKKTKLVAWFVSNCNSQSERYRYVKALSKFLPIDIFGRCGKLKCLRENGTCDEMLDTTYKFYLSFENSLCLDYVTEKFFRALKHYVIPIVYGGCNYSLIAPPNSYIDVAAFTSQKELAAYIIYLDKNPQAYRKYFWWKYFYTVFDNHKYILCQLCQMANNASLPPKNFEDINTWWSANICHKPQEQLFL